VTLTEVNVDPAVMEISKNEVPAAKAATGFDGYVATVTVPEPVAAAATDEPPGPVVEAVGSVPVLEADESGATDVGTTALDAAEADEAAGPFAVTVKVYDTPGWRPDTVAVTALFATVVETPSGVETTVSPVTVPPVPGLTQVT
jgi:hypothetical protein